MEVGQKALHYSRLELGEGVITRINGDLVDIDFESAKFTSIHKSKLVVDYISPSKYIQKRKSRAAKNLKTALVEKDCVNSSEKTEQKVGKNKKRETNILFGIGTHGGMFVWIFWGFLGSLISPLIGVVIVLLLLGINVLNAFEEHKESSKSKSPVRTPSPVTPLQNSDRKTDSIKYAPSRNCSRCGGSGYLACYSHVAGGVCFRCNGSGCH